MPCTRRWRRRIAAVGIGPAVPVNTPSFPTFNVVGTPGQVNDWDQYNARIDHQLTSADQIFGTFSYSDEARDVKVLRPKGGEGFPLNNRLVTMTWNRTSRLDSEGSSR